MKKTLFFSCILLLLLNLQSFSQTCWQSLNTNTTDIFSKLSFIDSNTGVAVGGVSNHGTITKTTNGGINWYTVLTTTSSTSAIFKDVVFPHDANTGYAVGGYYPVSLIYKTTNRGETWVQKISGTQYQYFSVAFPNVNTGYAVGDWGSIIKTTNAGDSWFILQPPSNEYLESVFFINVNTGFAVGREGQFIKTTNAGLNWSISYIYPWLNSVYFVNENTGFCVGINGRILKTTNGGNEWQAKQAGTTITFNEVCFINSLTGYITGDNGNIFYSSNGGDIWINQPSGTNQQLNSVLFLNNYLGYVCGTNGVILKTVSGGLPIVPYLISPSNGALNVQLTPTMTWNSVLNALNYKIEISGLQNFDVIKDSATVNNTQHTVPINKLMPATTYFWRVCANFESGRGPWSEIWNFGTNPINIHVTSNYVPQKYELFGNFPNPFNPETKIRFDIPKSTIATLEIFDVSGKKIKTLFSREFNTGSYESTFRAEDLPSGNYFYVLKTNDFYSCRKMTLLK